MYNLQSCSCSDTGGYCKSLYIVNCKLFIDKFWFYENKARQIIELSRQIVEELDGKVPDEIEDLIKLVLDRI